MSAELGLILVACAELVAIVTLEQIGVDRLRSLIIVNLILISLFGSILISVVGYTTNMGNVLYTAISFALYLIIDKNGKETGKRVIFTSLFMLLLFTLLANTLNFSSSIPGEHGAILKQVFDANPRVLFASLLAFLMAQHFNVWLYVRLSSWRNGWFRTVTSNSLTQVIDSAIFFFVAFYAIVPLGQVLEIMTTGLAIKVLAGVLIATGLSIVGLTPLSSTPASAVHK